MDRCVDCGEAISICDHAVKRLLDPERSYSLGEIESLTAEIERLRSENEAAIREVEQSTERWATTPVCEDCGMRHAPNDTAACIEGHGDDLEWGEDSATQQIERGRG